VDRCCLCAGARLEGDHCLAHLAAAELDRVVDRLRCGQPLDARRVSIAPDRLAFVIAALTPTFGDRAVLPDVDCTDAEFHGDVTFGAAHFLGDARFAGASFGGDADFSGCHFSGDVFFDTAQFSGDAVFRDAQFLGTTRLGAKFAGLAACGRARFEQSGGFLAAEFKLADFAGTSFSGDVDFGDPHFSGLANFQGTHFEANTTFEDARFEGVGNFSMSEFGGPLFFRAQFDDDAVFREAKFMVRVSLGPCLAVGAFRLDEVVFEQDVRLDVSASRLRCVRTWFGGRADLNVRWAEVTLDEATFKERSRLAAAEPFPHVDETRLRAASEHGARPRVLSVRQSRVENLAMSGVDLRACRFARAQGLDELRIEADCAFPQSPDSRRYTSRRTLAEEHAWRSDTRGEPGWRTATGSEADGGDEVLDPPVLATMYRSLRKGFEDRKDAPGAGDFYYGEMEMRRLTPRGTVEPEGLRHPRGEQSLLNLYWLVSGYGLRGSRALCCLAITVLAGAGLLAWFGFHPDRNLGRSLLFSLESTVSLLRAPTAHLSAGGELVQITLRLLGPLFFGLALLALRGRVKR
jgi:Pentapeptide repeats (9 copies)